VATVASGPQVGDRAPDFTLRRTFDDDVRLHDVLAAGPALVAFYVFDFGGI
jgi:peroxiredoxin